MRIPCPGRWLAAPAMLAALALTAVPAEAQIGFDDLPSLSDVPSAYASYTWSNWYTVDGCGVLPGTGYCFGTISPENVGLNSQGFDASISGASPFVFGGAWLTSAWPLNELGASGVQITGFLGATQLYQSTVSLVFGTTQFFAANWTGINRLEFSSRPTQGFDKQFVMDDIYLSADPGTGVVPEPATMSLLATGLAGMAAARRRRKQA